MQLRSGQLKNPPVRTHISSYQIFFAEKAKEMKQDGNKLQVGELGSRISQMWKNLDEEEREKYDDMFEKQESKYKEDLIIYYGGNEKDIKKYKNLLEVPPRPKKPVSGCLVYIAENRKQYGQDHPDISQGQITKALADKYQDLSLKEKKKYEDDYNRKHHEYEKDLEEWQKKFADKYEQFDKLVEEKFKRSVQKQDLEYQELPPYKRKPRLLKTEEDTEQQKQDKKKDVKQDKEKEKEKEKEKQKDDKKKDMKEQPSKKGNQENKDNKKDQNRKKSAGRRC